MLGNIESIPSVDEDVDSYKEENYTIKEILNFTVLKMKKLEKICIIVLKNY